MRTKIKQKAARRFKRANGSKKSSSLPLDTTLTEARSTPHKRVFSDRINPLVMVVAPVKVVPP